MSPRQRFHGQIAGVGSASGIRVVVGHWHDTPLGPFSDAMVETRAGHRVLLAPHEAAAAFIAATYTFDEVRVEALTVVSDGSRWVLRSPSLTLDLTVGGVTWLGRLLRLVPPRLARAPWWCTVTDPVARTVLRGVRTRGAANGARREWCGATGHRCVTDLAGSFEGVPLGPLGRVEPTPRFGFSSTPSRPSVTDVTTTVETPAQRAVGSSRPTTRPR